ncbi:MAG: ADP-ribosyltransferase [Terriglobia bacterium]
MTNPPVTQIARKFTSGEEVDEWGNKQWARVEPHLTDRDKADLRQYTGAAYDTINRSLRGGTALEGNMPGLVKSLDSIFDNPVLALDEPIVTYRGVSYEPWSKLTKDDIGTLMIDPGFASTTPNLQRATSYVNENLTLLEITLPEGSKAIWLGNLQTFIKEQEVLLGRGSKMILRDIAEDVDVDYGDKYRLLQVDLIN